MFLDRGQLSARRTAHDGFTRTMAVFLPGAVIGEIGLYAEVPRTATIVADAPSVIRRLDLDDLRRLCELDPALARDLHGHVARVLARRLAYTAALVGDLSR
jgi:SulP family sulfate permease